MTELRFDGRVAVITGSGRGLGRAYALLLAGKGAKVVVNDLGAPIKGDGADAGVAQQLVDEIAAAGGDAVANVDSVATPEGARAIVQSAIDAYGKIDSLIVVAAPRTLGELRKHYHKALSAVLAGEIAKDLTGHSIADVEKTIAAA